MTDWESTHASNEDIKTLLELGADADGYFADSTPLITAIEEGWEYEVVNELIEAGADVNIKREGRTPLLAAVRRGDADIAKRLIEGACRDMCTTISNAVGV